MKKKRTNLSFLVACEGLGVTKKSKSCDVRCCVCVVLVHQPVEARLVFSIFVFLFMIFTAPGGSSVEPGHAVHGALVGLPHILLTHLQ